jgi:FtsZ-interacting cell division protein ZipA
MPKLDATLRKLRPLLNKEELLDDDIVRMQREATRPTKAKATTGKKKVLSKKAAAASNKIGRALPEPKKFDWPQQKHKPVAPAKTKNPVQKKHTTPLAPARQPKKEPFPGDFSLKKFMLERGVS